MRYCVYNEWSYPQNKDKCIIYLAKKEDECYDGQNMYSRLGGFDFSIYDSLEEAILNSHYNPKYIEFKDLSDKELTEKDKILEKYIWTCENGYELKNGVK